VNRRNFITLVGGATATWPLSARAQQRVRTRRIGVLMNLASDDPEGQDRVAAFMQGLQESGWAIGRDVRIDYRWGAGDTNLFRKYAAELVALAPDAILAASGSALPFLLEATRSIPIVFAQTADPVGSGYVASLAQPGGNATGFTQIDFGMTGKWLELLKEIAPKVTRAAVIRDSRDLAGLGQWGAIQALAPSLGLEVSPVSAQDANEMQRAIMAFARSPNGGLVVTASAPTAVYRETIIALAAQQRLPAVYPFRYHITAGGLVSYGPDPIDQYRRAAGYINRILKGEKPGDLPVQAPTRYELVINMKTAKALGLEMPATVLARADEVIE
jgi:putative tryptophan/tyrosine transport system substrate-binding protein